MKKYRFKFELLFGIDHVRFEEVERDSNDDEEAKKSIDVIREEISTRVNKGNAMFFMLTVVPHSLSRVEQPAVPEKSVVVA